MKITKTNLKNISKDEFQRFDAKFYSFFEISEWNIFQYKGELVRLKDILVDDRNVFKLKDGEDYYGIPTGQTYIDEDGKIESYQLVNSENVPNRIKYKINERNILISSLKLAKAPAMNFNDIDFEKYIFSNGYHILKLKDKWNLKFVVMILRHSKVKKLIDENLCRGIGISSYKLDDLLKIEIPNVDTKLQNIVVKSITPIEEEIYQLKTKVNNLSQIIDETFGRYFDFDYDEFEKLKNVRTYKTSFKSLSRDTDTRFSAKFHRPSGEYVTNELNRVCGKKIKNFILAPIMTGKGISPKDYDEGGNYRYASMADISSWYLDEKNMKGVSDEYIKKNSSKKPKGYKDSYDTTIQKGDVLMIRSGEGSIGKVALVENDTDAIFSDFVIRIRLTNYNPKFAYYYFRTTYFQYLIEIYKKGLGNNTNIFPIVLQDFPIPDISLDEQEKIVNIIDEKINENKLIDEKIKQKRIEIEQLIDKHIIN